MSISAAMIALPAVLIAAVALLAPSSARSADVHVIAEVHQPVAVLARPGGPVVAELSSRTTFGSPRALSVVTLSGRWLRVTTSDLPSGSAGWVDGRSRALTYTTTRLSITIRLDARTLELRSGSHVVRRFTVGVGSGGTPTPRGRFSVTDELAGANYSRVYGCCILALSARQTRLPAGWTAGDRIAIHGTNQPSTIGRAESAGCLHAADADVRYLMEHVPLGTAVTIVS
jgi:lipoprotein-anchoring transpeptidase ErfK/SrfK